MRRSTTVAGSYLVGLISSLPAAAVGLPALRVEQSSAVTATRAFDPSRPETHPEDMPELEPGRDAITACDFWCKPVLSYQTTSTAVDADGCTANVSPVEIRLILELHTTSWLPASASPELTRQEAAHREICERVYESSRASIERNLRETLAFPLVGRAIDCEDAITTAITKEAVLTYCVPFTRSGVESSRRVTGIYDYLTSSENRRPLPASAAIRAALRLAQRETGEPTVPDPR